VLCVGIIIVERGYETWHAHIELDNKVPSKKRQSRTYDRRHAEIYSKINLLVDEGKGTWEIVQRVIMNSWLALKIYFRDNNIGGSPMIVIQSCIMVILEISLMMR